MPDYWVKEEDERQAAFNEWLSRRPVCSLCGEPITAERAVRINEDWICDICIEFLTEEVKE